MKNVLIVVILVLFMAVPSFAETEEGHAGLYVVKNAKITVMRNNPQTGQNTPDTTEELIKINTATGQVWVWNEMTDGQGGVHTAWSEMTEADLNMSKK